MEPNQISVIAPASKKTHYRIIYTIVLTGELSGAVRFSGSVTRAASDETTALSEVHQYLSQSGNMYPSLTVDGDAALITPDFPPEFSGRPIKTVTVRCIGKYDPPR